MVPQVKLRIPWSLFEKIIKDLRREHEFAFERAGFTFGRAKNFGENRFTIFLNEYMPVDDKNYINDKSVGARINSTAITNAMQVVFTGEKSSFHTHLHDFEYDDIMPQFSLVDREELPPIAKSAISFAPEQVHGCIVLSGNSINAIVFLPGFQRPIQPVQISIVGYPMVFVFPQHPFSISKSERYSRQSFLGQNAQDLISRLKIGVVGLSGGGSHIFQQLAHIGFKKYVLFDKQNVDWSNTNRLVGSTLKDVKNEVSKFFVASRLIKSLHPDAEIEGGQMLWQDSPELLQDCDIVLGSVDTFAGRRDLESECRRFLIPYIDIGMDIVKSDDEPHNMFGQVQLSMPGEPCMICRGFLSEENLAKEANKYGDAGERPQVVWANGILASSAISVLIDLITNWTAEKNRQVYLSYEGNRGILNKHIKLDYPTSSDCKHYRVSDTGPVRL